MASSSSMSKAYVSVDLPTEVLCDIFFRLPSLEPVYKFRCVSKLWNSLLSEPSFINKIFNTLNSIPWIFMYDPKYRQVQLYLNRNHKFINHHDGLSFKFLTDSVPFKPRGLREQVRLLDSCSNGLVLYSTYPLVINRDSPSWKHKNSKFYICNPLTKQRVSLPPRPYTHQEFYDQRTDPLKRQELYTKLVCESSTASLSQCICNYKVVCIYSYRLNKNFSLQIFSSDSGEWETFPWPNEIWGPNIWHDFSSMLIRHGALYWTAHGDYYENENIFAAYSTLENSKKGSDGCRSIAFPMIKSFRYYSFFAESEGSIYYGYIYPDHKAFLSLWLLEDDYTDGGFNWQIVDKNIELNGNTPSQIECVYLNPVDRNVIIIVDRGCCLAYNFKTLKHKFLLGCPVPKTRRKCETIIEPFIITPKPTVIPLFKWLLHNEFLVV